MGFAPQQVDRMSMWQFFAALNGWAAAHSPQRNKLSETEASELFDWISGPGAARTLTTQTWWLDGDRLVRNRLVTFTVE